MPLVPGARPSRASAARNETSAFSRASAGLGLGATAVELSPPRPVRCLVPNNRPASDRRQDDHETDDDRLHRALSQPIRKQAETHLSQSFLFSIEAACHRNSSPGQCDLRPGGNSWDDLATAVIPSILGPGEITVKRSPATSIVRAGESDVTRISPASRPHLPDGRASITSEFL